MNDYNALNDILNNTNGNITFSFHFFFTCCLLPSFGEYKFIYNTVMFVLFVLVI